MPKSANEEKREKDQEEVEGGEEEREAGGEEEEEGEEDDDSQMEEDDTESGREGRQTRSGAINDRTESRSYGSVTHKCEVRVQYGNPGCPVKTPPCSHENIYTLSQNSCSPLKTLVYTQRTPSIFILFIHVFIFYKFHTL